MLKILEKKDFPRVYEIMKESFPKEEHRSYEDQLALMDREEYKLYGACDPTGELMGFLGVWELPEILFIEHFAVKGSCRNQGIGSESLKLLLLEYSTPACLEVEEPQSMITERRIAFYERHGFCVNDFFYQQPSLGQGREPVPLKIMTTGGPLTQQGFETLRDLLYRRVYGLQTEG